MSSTRSDSMLEQLLARLDDSERGWRAPTPAPGWDVASQVAHLAWTDEAAIAAATDKERWDELVLGALGDPEGFVDAAAADGAAVPAAELLARWDAGRARLADVLRTTEGKLSWFGPPMSPSSMATARLMETWAHAHDVTDALGLPPSVTDRIKHVCHLGIRTRDWVFGNHGLTPPAGEFRIELAAPSGAVWTWGPQDSAGRVSGTAYDFARLVTQRIHRDDAALVATGAEAQQWLGIAQAFAGPPGVGRERRG